MTIQLKQITDFLSTTLQADTIPDIALNGLQIEANEPHIKKVALAVDAGLSVLQEAVKQEAQLLITHHGLFWGNIQPITGVFAAKIGLCLQNGLSLYSAHLPLDGHIELGNAAVLGSSILQLIDIESAYEYKGFPLGVRGRLQEPKKIEEIAKLLAHCEGALNPPHILAFGPKTISTIGIATGSGSSCINDTVSLGLDLLITGESKQEAYHEAKELGCNVIFMGHYASETFGVRALGDVLMSKFGVETVWISEPTGI